MDEWNSFMQSRQARIVMNAICVAFCLYYTIDALMEIFTPERAEQMIAMIGETNFYLMDIGRAVVCLITGIAFARMLHKALAADE